MTEKDLNLTLATLTFLVQSLVRLQTKRTRAEMRRQIQLSFQKKEAPLYGLTLSEVRASVEAFVNALQ